MSEKVPLLDEEEWQMLSEETKEALELSDDAEGMVIRGLLAQHGLGHVGKTNADIELRRLRDRMERLEKQIALTRAAAIHYGYGVGEDDE